MLLVTWPITRLSTVTSAADAGATVPVQRQADQLPGDAAVAAMQHADDDFLPDVAPFRETDRARLDSRFERNRLLRPCRG